MEELNKFLNNKSKKYKSSNNLYFIKEYKKEFVNNKIKKNSNVDSELLCKNIQHNNLMSLFSYVETKYYEYVCFKYYPFSDLITYYEQNYNESINNIYKNNRIIIKQLVDAVIYLHKNNIAHLDIKLDNILYDKLNTNIILCDFEYCTKINSNGFSIDKIERAKGTKLYIAPEWFYNDLMKIDLRKIDVWNIGIVSYIILTKGNTNDIHIFKDANETIINSNLEKSNNTKEEIELVINTFQTNLNKRLDLVKVRNLKFFG